MNAPLIEVRNLQVAYQTRGSWGKRGEQLAVRNVTFSLRLGETLGIVGESGCGKTTLGRTVLALLPSYRGQIFFCGTELAACSPRERRAMQQDMAMIFQDTIGALNPRKTALESVTDALKYRGVEPRLRGKKAKDALRATGLSKTEWEQYPHTLSGGQRQRVSIARALVGSPKLIVCDEPISALDGAVRRQILTLLQAVQQETGAGLIFISHDLWAVRELCQKTAVMYFGQFVETGDTSTLFRQPAHPYTKALMEAALIPDPDAPDPKPLPGELPDIAAPPKGCPFHPRCPRAERICQQECPELRLYGAGNRQVACFFPSEQ